MYERTSGSMAKNFLHELEGREPRRLPGVLLVGSHEGAGHRFRQQGV